MPFAEISEIVFDEQDINLFQVEDARLRADALRHSILPRLRVVMDTAISLIRDVYDLEALDDSIISVYPNFRQRRDNELKVLYTEVFVGLGGQRSPKWPGFSRKNGKPVQIVPFRYAFILGESGIMAALINGWMRGLENECYERLIRFHLDNEPQINSLLFASKMRPQYLEVYDMPVITSLKEQYEYRIANELYDNHYIGCDYSFPASEEQLTKLITDFITFFPLYDSYIQIAKGMPTRLDELIAKLNIWLEDLYYEQYDDEEENEDIDESEDTESEIDNEYLQQLAAEAAEKRVKVIPGIRWQTFQRDQWKCVSCGRSSHNNIILHVDHIIPRSRGGSDSLDNFQTLCNICNIGKSNRDSTDLRRKINRSETENTV